MRDEGAAALLAQRVALDAAHDSDRALLLREVCELTSRLDAMRSLAVRDAADADARVEAVKGAVTYEVEGAVGVAHWCCMHRVPGCFLSIASVFVLSDPTRFHNVVVYSSNKQVNDALPPAYAHNSSWSWSG